MERFNVESSYLVGIFIKMLKTYQFKTHCKGDSHSSKTANIVLPGFMIKTKMNDLTSASEMVLKFIELHYVG